MDNKRIVIIGSSGSGKSTLARTLHEMFTIPIVHLDKLLWLPGWIQVSKEVFDSLLLDELKKDAWIMDGNYNRTLQKRLDCCDTVIYLDYSRITCLLGVIKRVILNYGKTRADMSENCPEKFDYEFIKYTWNFNKNVRDKNLSMLANCNQQTVHIFKNRSECKRYVRKLRTLNNF